MSGTQTWGKKNIPKFQREEGAFLKMLMTAITVLLGSRSSSPFGIWTQPAPWATRIRSAGLR
eukprot:3681008-Alexandrium_andersonii.AAC.1